MKRPRIGLEQKVAGLDERALLIVVAHEVPVDARPDLGVDIPDQWPHPLRGDRHVLLDHGLDPDRGWRGRPGGPGRVATAGGESRDYDNQQVSPQTARDTHSEGHPSSSDSLTGHVIPFV